MNIRVMACFCVVPFLFSCSLKYTEEELEELGVPEIVFSDADYLRYEDGKVVVQMQADELEQYRDDNAMYAKNVNFKTFNAEGNLSAEGTCNLICANTVSDSYVLIGSVDLVSHENKMSLSTQNLSWDGRSEQLTSGERDKVSISKWDDQESKTETTDDDGTSRIGINMTGSGFSASGISRSFQFTGPVSGVIIQYDGNQEESKETSE